MRILLIENPQSKDRYSSFIQNLVLNHYAQQGYEIIDQAELSGKKQYSVTGDAIFISTNKAADFILSKTMQQQALAAFCRRYSITTVVQSQHNYIHQLHVPQLVAADNAEALQKATFKNNTMLAIPFQQSVQTLTDNGFAKKDTTLVHAAADHVYRPLEWSEKQQVKMTEADASEYFLVSKNFTKLEDLLNLLKAFSSFKRWQHSSMKLMLTGKILLPQDDWQQRMSSYKYREDVVYKSKLSAEETALIVSSAYAFIHLAAHDADVFPLLAAMQCHTPCISFTNKKIQSYTEGAAAWVAEDNAEALGEKMILLYKDEQYRAQLVSGCARQSAKYTLAGAAAQLVNAIELLGNR